MDTKDIMIGDWVMKPYPNDRESLREGQIEPDDFYLEEEWETISDCKPIPLTKEILEKNGWKYLKNSLNTEVMILPNDKGNAFLWWVMDIKEMCLIGGSYIPIYYVHELQHLLRLIGYDKEIVI